ncbi:hypothetical protein [Kitasatospora sp. NPDC051914]|uniref:hypothetical protein n=1 Tax=Kitasatospora sp. NPDC051914 TaxID=3154945 RepID=UPI003431E07D
MLRSLVVVLLLALLEALEPPRARHVGRGSAAARGGEEEQQWSASSLGRRHVR